MSPKSYHIKFFLFIFLFSFIFAVAKAQSYVNALRIDEEITIDGRLDEPAWQNAIPAADFIVYHPENGKKPDQQSEIWVLYDDNSIYIGAKLKDDSPEKILTELSPRNHDNANVDYFGISLNPNNDGHNLYEFIVSAANVQTDIRVSGDTKDYDWNAVWYSEVSITDEGWIVEVEIPYSAIRFPQAYEQTWAVNFWRTVRRTREQSSWNYVDPAKGNKASQMGMIKGISNIDAPLRLSLMPYLSAYADRYSAAEASGYSVTGGLDLKLGLSETYTFDMTLIPDFGQVKSDEEVLNLSAHETYYAENRPFFTEGTELFNKCGLFYSRRIGKIPDKYYDIIDKENQGYQIISNPRYSRLINALKISGRGESNLAVGVFNAITGNTYAELINPEGENEKVLTESSANYNMLVLDQSIGNYSYINFTNANVYRNDNSYVSNVGATAFQLMDANNRFGAKGTIAYSLQNDETGRLADGWTLNSSIGKMNGQWIYSFDTEVISDEYNPNDIGFLTEFNQVSNSLNVAFRQFTPFSIFNNMTHRLSLAYNSLYSGSDFVSTVVRLNSVTTTRKFHSFWNNLTITPQGVNDYYEPRKEGRFYYRPAMIENNFNISTDYRKQLAIDARIGFLKDAEQKSGISGSLSPLTRFGQKLTLRYRFSFDYVFDEVGFAEIANNDSIIFGRRDVQTFSNSINADYIFTNKISLSFIVRHYASTIDYAHFYNLNNDGSISPADSYTTNNDYNFNSFNLDLVFLWNFAPGSYFSAVWKNHIFSHGVIPENVRIPTYYENFNEIRREPAFNSFSVRFIYYLDYHSIIG